MAAASPFPPSGHSPRGLAASQGWLQRCRLPFAPGFILTVDIIMSVTLSWPFVFAVGVTPASPSPWLVITKAQSPQGSTPCSCPMRYACHYPRHCLFPLLPFTMPASHPVLALAMTAGSLPVIHPSKPLQQELSRLLLTAPFWNKDLEWLQSRAAVQALLPKATSGVDFARLLWLMEELLYEDLLKGSGWGRRRSWFRDQLESTRNIAQVCSAICPSTSSRWASPHMSAVVARFSVQAA